MALRSLRNVGPNVSSPPNSARRRPPARSLQRADSDKVTGATYRRWDCGPGISQEPQTCTRLKFDLLRDAERVINLDPEITHGALQLRVTKQQLHRSQVAGLLVNLCRLRSAQIVRPVCRAVEPGAVRPSMDDAGVLPRRQVWLSPQTAREQILPLASVEGGEPLADSSTGLLGNLELHRPTSLLLNDG